MSLHGATVGRQPGKIIKKKEKKNHKLKAQSSEHTKERADYLSKKKGKLTKYQHILSRVLNQTHTYTLTHTHTGVRYSIV